MCGGGVVGGGGVAGDARVGLLALCDGRLSAMVALGGGGQGGRRGEGVRVRVCGGGVGQEEVESPVTLLWVLFYLASHHDRRGRHEAALALMDEAQVAPPGGEGATER